MEDMLPETEQGRSQAVGIASENSMWNSLGVLLMEHKGQDVSVLDLRGICDWIDFFVIATVSSNAHMDGLERHIMEFCRENGFEVLRKSRKSESGDDEWRLIDLGSMFIHLMTKSARSFYDLERLYRPTAHSEAV